MSKTQRTAITPTRAENYPEWYQQVVKAADLAENSPVRGCMVIKPWGYGIWENIQRIMDGMFKDTGHVNAYFPLLIPLSFLQQEADHVEGFAKECAVVTHHRLKTDASGRLVPDGLLEEPFVIRPTSETIIGASYAKWVQSYRDLPILINQWANVMRWEMRTRMFLRTTEFLWQEGHTVHATAAEAMEETLRMLDVYETFARDVLAMPVYKGEKCSWERFPGAVNTYAIEAMMQDRKALQAGTSHFLGQNFAKASQIKFLDADGKECLAWTTSWGTSTRMIGGLIMTHSDDDGLVLPPRVAPRHVVMLPIYRTDEERRDMLACCDRLKKGIEETPYAGERIRILVDDRDMRGGEKAWQHVKKGVPLRVEIGPRDLAAGVVSLARRDTGEKRTVAQAEIMQSCPGILSEIQANLLARAESFRAANTVTIRSRQEFQDFFQGQDDDKAIGGGFAVCPWIEDPSFKDFLTSLKVSPRVILAGPADAQPCIFTGKQSTQRMIFAKSY